MFDNFTPHPKPTPKGKKPKKPLPKRSKKWKAATKEERAHLAFIKSLPCICCGMFGVDAHHITQGGRRLGHKYTLPLCQNCHEGEFSIGNAKKSFIKEYGTELQLLEKLKQKYKLEVKNE